MLNFKNFLILEDMLVDKSKWGKALCKDCVKNINTQEAIQKKDYSSSGFYPIISQEKEYISGFTSSSSSLNVGLGDVVIFGDHTRVLKYVDFDFCVGADGVKVLKPIQSITPKFLYYFLKWSDIPSNGYSRHYKFLKEVEIKIPSLYEQEAIIKELDVAKEMIDGYTQQIEDLDKLTQSIFLDTFGDPLTNPKKWNMNKISSCGKVITGNTPSKSIQEYYNSNFIEWIKTDNIKKNDLYPTIASEYLSEEGSKKGRIVAPHSILVCCIAGSLNSIGRCCITNRVVAFNQQINAIECNNQHDYLFMYCLIKCAQKKFIQSASTGMKHILSKSVMSSIELPIPPLTLQKQFSAKVEAIEKQKTLLREQLADAEQLMAERMQYYFS